MAGLVRKTSIQFGNAGPTSAFGQFGSKQAGTPQTTQDPAVIQELTAWIEGWQNAVVSGDKAAYIEDLNGFCFVDSYQLTYLFQMGIPEYDAATLYFTGSVVQGVAGSANAGQWFQSLQGGTPGVGAGQSGNTPPTSASNAFWTWINSPTILDGGVTTGAGNIPYVSAAGPGTLLNSHLADDGSNITITAASGYGFKFADGSVQTSAAVANPGPPTVSSPPTAFRTVPIQPSGSSGSRAIGTTYQNSSAKPIYVSVCASGGGGAMFAYCDGTTNPTTIVVETGAGIASSPIEQMFFIVLPGYWYRISGGSLVTWTEWS